MPDTMSVVVRAIIAVLPNKLVHCSVTGGGGGSDGGGGRNGGAGTVSDRSDWRAGSRDMIVAPCTGLPCDVHNISSSVMRRR